MILIFILAFECDLVLASTAIMEIRLDLKDFQIIASSMPFSMLLASHVTVELHYKVCGVHYANLYTIDAHW